MPAPLPSSWMKPQGSWSFCSIRKAQSHLEKRGLGQVRRTTGDMNGGAPSAQDREPEARNGGVAGAGNRSPSRHQPDRYSRRNAKESAYCR